MLYREIMAVCSEIHTKHINTLCVQNVELLNVKLAVHMRECWWVLSPIRKETSYSDQTRHLFNTLPTKINTLLSPCPNFCKPLKKKIRRLSAQPGLRGNNGLRVGLKMATFQLFFSVQGTGDSPTGPDPENRVGDRDTGSPGRPLSSRL